MRGLVKDDLAKSPRLRQE